MTLHNLKIWPTIKNVGKDTLLVIPGKWKECSEKKEHPLFDFFKTFLGFIVNKIKKEMSNKDIGAGFIMRKCTLQGECSPTT